MSPPDMCSVRIGGLSIISVRWTSYIYFCYFSNLMRGCKCRPSLGVIFHLPLSMGGSTFYTVWVYKKSNSKFLWLQFMQIDSKSWAFYRFDSMSIQNLMWIQLCEWIHANPNFYIYVVPNLIWIQNANQFQPGFAQTAHGRLWKFM